MEAPPIHLHPLLWSLCSSGAPFSFFWFSFQTLGVSWSHFLFCNPPTTTTTTTCSVRNKRNKHFAGLHEQMENSADSVCVCVCVCVWDKGCFCMFSCVVHVLFPRFLQCCFFSLPAGVTTGCWDTSSLKSLTVAHTHRYYKHFVTKYIYFTFLNKL